MSQQLPPNWITQLDPASGRTFYVYTPTGQTQWEYPTGIPLPPAGGAQAPTNPRAPGTLANDPLSNALGMNQVQGGWMRTPQMKCSIPGLEKLMAVQDLYVKQDIQALEALSGGCCEFNNQYKVLNENGHLVYNAVEESDACFRCCCAPHHTLKVMFSDENGKTIAMLDRPYRCTGCCPALLPCCRSRATVTMGDDKKVRAMIYQPGGGGGFKPTFNLYTGENINIEMESADIENNLLHQGVVEGPWCCFGGFFESDFVVRTPNPDPSQSHVYGNITKEGTKDLKSAARELLTDADNFKIHFSEEDPDPLMRATMMANMVLLDFMFFENEGLFDCGFEDGGVFCALRPCDCYCYGCLCPCVLKVNSKDCQGG
jgi:hypothetical protein